MTHRKQKLRAEIASETDLAALDRLEIMQLKREEIWQEIEALHEKRAALRDESAPVEKVEEELEGAWRRYHEAFDVIGGEARHPLSLTTVTPQASMLSAQLKACWQRDRQVIGLILDASWKPQHSPLPASYRPFVESMSSGREDARFNFDYGKLLREALESDDPAIINRPVEECERLFAP